MPPRQEPRPGSAGGASPPGVCTAHLGQLTERHRCWNRREDLCKAQRRAAVRVEALRSRELSLADSAARD